MRIQENSEDPEVLDEEGTLDGETDGEWEVTQFMGYDFGS
jgi:hypothetical protein